MQLYLSPTQPLNTSHSLTSYQHKRLHEWWRLIFFLTFADACSQATAWCRWGPMLSTMTSTWSKWWRRPTTSMWMQGDSCLVLKSDSAPSAAAQTTPQEEGLPGIPDLISSHRLVNTSHGIIACDPIRQNLTGTRRVRHETRDVPCTRGRTGLTLPCHLADCQGHPLRCYPLTLWWRGCWTVRCQQERAMFYPSSRMGKKEHKSPS